MPNDYMLDWSNPWLTVVPAIASVLVILLAVELVIALVKMAVKADSSDGGDV